MTHFKNCGKSLIEKSGIQRTKEAENIATWRKSKIAAKNKIANPKSTFSALILFEWHSLHPSILHFEYNRDHSLYVCAMVQLVVGTLPTSIRINNIQIRTPNQFTLHHVEYDFLCRELGALSMLSLRWFLKYSA